MKTRTTVARLESGGVPYLLKFHHWAGFWKTISKSRAVSPNRWSFQLGASLHAAGIPTPRPLACIDCGFGPLRTCSYLLTEFISGTSLYDLLRSTRLDEALASGLASQVAAIWHSLDEMQVSHNDLKPENFMIDARGHVWLIDLENARRHTNRHTLRRCQNEDLRRLLHARSWQNNPVAYQAFRDHLRQLPSIEAAIAAQGSDHPLAADAACPALERISVIIPCRNGHRGLAESVQSVRSFADEILVVVEHEDEQAWQAAENIPSCRTLGCERLDHDSLRRLIGNAQHPWVLLLAPHECVSPDLGKEIQFLLADSPRHAAYQIERRTLLGGNAVRFGDLGPDYPVRLTRRDTPIPLLGSDTAKTGAGITLGRLRGRIVRDAYHTVPRSSKGSRADGRAGRLSKRTTRKLLHFLRSYVGRLGFLDGLTGVRVARYAAAFADSMPRREFPRGRDDPPGRDNPPGRDDPPGRDNPPLSDAPPPPAADQGAAMERPWAA